MIIDTSVDQMELVNSEDSDFGYRDIQKAWFFFLLRMSQLHNEKFQGNVFDLRFVVFEAETKLCR